LGDGGQWGLSLNYAEQESPGGIAQAILIAGDFLGGQRACLILGDNLFYGGELTPLLQRAAGRKHGATVFAYRVSDPQRYGVVSFDPSGHAVSLVEKPARPGSNYAVTGLYFYDDNAFDMASRLRASVRGELKISDLNPAYLELELLTAEHLGRGIAWLDTGTPDALLHASNFVQIVEQRQGLKIACLEEIAFNLGYIGLDQVVAQAKPIANTEYGQYLLRLADQPNPQHDFSPDC
jgi:glucose-1-phosphate thymidylyltransferase